MKQKSIFLWLLLCIFLVYSMIIIGGYTRLSHSGLSIVEWSPVSGTIPPLSEDSWNIEFSKYKQSPEFQKVNYSISLNEFKEIFLVEYFHRLLGRILGLVFIVPLLYFILSKTITFYESRYYIFVGLLIGLQGLVGWLMVKSGLIDQPNVSQYRLALHLSLASILLILLVVKIADIKFISNRYGCFSLVLLLLQIISGAFVAGLHAGLTYNTFPLMDGELIPSGLWLMKPWYVNIFENITMVQFLHRILGVINFINISFYAYVIYSKASKIAILLFSIVGIQFILGVLTLLLQVPLKFALLHQGVAMLLLISIVFSLKKEESNSFIF